MRCTDVRTHYYGLETKPKQNQFQLNLKFYAN